MGSYLMEMFLDMKRIFTLILSAGAMLASANAQTVHFGDSVWFHYSVLAGSVNGRQFWGELDIENKGTGAETLLVSERRYSGALILESTYTLAPGEKRTIRIDDPDLHMDMVNPPADKQAPDELRSTVLIEPALPRTGIGLRQLELVGDELKTAWITPYSSVRPQNRQFAPLNPKGQPFYFVSNLSGKKSTVVVCESDSLSIFFPSGCGTQAQRIDLPPFSTVRLPLPSLYYRYLLAVFKSVGVLSSGAEASVSTETFHVNSGITFGSPVKQ